ncbi:MAG TPA: sortase [Roseiflexaceae bacterium]|nr:sortase [Roseiflexaceae bacterium]
MTRRAKIFWTLGNCLMLFGVLTLLYAGGLYSIDMYGRYAARGDSDVPMVVVTETSDEEAEPAPFVAPVLNTSSAAAADSSTQAAPEYHGTVARIVIPSIKVDSKVVEVGWDMESVGDQQVPVWQVAKYAVGQHEGSANPGEGGNIVMAGHVGGFGLVFKLLYYVKPGDQITLYSNGEQYLYVVKDRLLVQEEGVSPEQHAANAQLIAPTDHEMVTLVTCWPGSGPDKFTKRVVVQAVPFASTTSTSSQQSSWAIR